jgi:hypothetical protein
MTFGCGQRQVGHGEDGMSSGHGRVEALGAVGAAPSTMSCGCDAPARWVCDVCRASSLVQLACSRACFERHFDEAHPEAPRSAAQRARAVQRALNVREEEPHYRAFESHRKRVTEIVCARAAGPKLCVFGAGNAWDIDLGTLLTRFETVHLVDVDSESLERARARAPSGLRERLVLHGDVDLTGLLQRLDELETIDGRQIAELAVVAAKQIVERVGSDFDTTLSTCVLSQLVLPFQRSWARSAMEWGVLEAALTALHLTTLSGATRPGGSSVLVFDVLSSKYEPGLDALADQSTEALVSFVARSAARLQPKPDALLDQLRTPGLAALFARPALTTPWLWRLDDTLQLVYALVFRRP